MYRHKSPTSYKTPLSTLSTLPFNTFYKNFLLDPSNDENELKILKKIAKSTVKRNITPLAHQSSKNDGTTIQKLNSARTKSSGNIHGGIEDIIEFHS